MEAIQQWFNNLKRSEQQILFVGGVLVLLYLLYVLLWQPTSAGIERLQQHNVVAAEQLQSVRALAAEYKQLKGSDGGGRSNNFNLQTLIDNTVSRNQLHVKRMQPSASGDVQVRFENAVFNKVVAWLYDLEVANGVVVKDLSINPGNGSGLVNVSVRLRKG